MRIKLAFTSASVSIGLLAASVVHGATTYVPGDQVLSQLTRSAAVRQVRVALHRADYFHAGARDIDRSSIRIMAREIQFSENRSPKSLLVAQVEPGTIKVERTGVRATEYSVFVKGFAQVFWPSEEPAREFADAIYALARYARGASAPVDATAEAEFAKAAARYRETSTKPELPEAARKFRIQAEAALRDKEFDDAAEFYAEALKQAPWWPEGRFNRALILSELGEYDEAISEMKKYLALAPDAPNARATQDKIYEWEGKTNITR